MVLKRLLSLMLLAFSVLSLVGCTERKTLFHYEQEASEHTIGFPMTMDDGFGHTLSLEKPAEIILCADTPSLSFCAAMNILDRTYSLTSPEGELFRQVLSNNPTQLQPDLILCTDTQNISSSIKDYYLLTGSASRLDTIMTSCINISSAFDLREDINILGRYCMNMKDKIMSLEAHIGFSEQKKVLFLNPKNSHMAAFTGSGHIINDILDTVGGRNALPENLATDGSFVDYGEYYQDPLVAPDIIWIPFYSSYTANDIATDPIFADSPAVLNGQIYLFPGALEPWYEPSPSAYCGMCWAMHNLHPDDYPLSEMKQDINGYYQLTFKQVFSLEEMGVLDNGAW